MILNDYCLLFRLARRAQGKTQSWVAGKVGISRATLAQFETGKPAISAETMRRIAPILNINPAYIADPSANPFLSKDLITMELPRAAATGVSLEAVYFLTEANSVLKVLLLVSTTPPARRLFSGSGNHVVAVACRDGDGNIFLLTLQRRLSRTGEEKLKGIPARYGTDMKFITVEGRAIGNDLFVKIVGSVALKEDIAALFSGPCVMAVSEDQKKVLDRMREAGISASAVLDLMDRV